MYCQLAALLVWHIETCNALWKETDDLLDMQHPCCWAQKIFTTLFEVSFNTTFLVITSEPCLSNTLHATFGTVLSIRTLKISNSLVWLRMGFEMRHMLWGKTEGVEWNTDQREKFCKKKWGVKFSTVGRYEIRNKPVPPQHRCMCCIRPLYSVTKNSSSLQAFGWVVFRSESLLVMHDSPSSIIILRWHCFKLREVEA